ncbi:MAG: hypothetical protein WBO04_10785 [Steroidobacteraceae bacterium]
MVEAKTRRLATALAVMAGVALSGCEVSSDGPESPPPPTETFKALFYTLSGSGFPYLPWPTDFMFSGTVDGTLNIPVPTGTSSADTLLLGTPLYSALNLLDGFSTTASTKAPFTLPIDGSTLTASTVRVIELNLVAPSTPSSTNPVSRVLAHGTDYTVEVSTEVDTGGKLLKITPTKPFRYSKGANGVGYLFLVTNGVQDINGQPAQADDLYAAIKAAPSCDAFTNATQNGICLAVKGQLQIAGLVFGAEFAGNVILSWSYMTQSVDETLEYLSANVGPQPIGVVAVPGATSPLGAANIYVGTTQMPYYSRRPATVNDASILSSFWVAGTPPPAPWVSDPNLPFNPLTRYNPVPVPQGGNVTVPVIVSVPIGCAKPASGWPVAIVQHGLGRNRTDALSMADSFGAPPACTVVVGFDLPLHGITDTANPFYQADNERTFNIDLVNNATGATGPDGVIDDSGYHFFNNLVSSPLTGRDGLRQSAADLGVLTKSVANLDLNADGAGDVDLTKVHYVGLSMGGIVGIAHAKFTPGLLTATVAAPGGVLSQLGNESPTFGPTIRAGLARQSALFVPNSAFFNNFMRDTQTILDPGDPINHICECGTQQPLLMYQMSGDPPDQVVPNSTTQNLVRAGDFRQLRTVGPNPVGVENVWVKMIAGDHGSLMNPAASLEATTEMQTEVVGFTLSANAGTPAVIITDDTVVEVDPD